MTAQHHRHEAPIDTVLLQIDDPFHVAIGLERPKLVAISDVQIAFGVDRRGIHDRKRVEVLGRLLRLGRPEHFTVRRDRIEMAIVRGRARHHIRGAVEPNGWGPEDRLPVKQVLLERERGPELDRDEVGIRAVAMPSRPEAVEVLRTEIGIGLALAKGRRPIREDRGWQQRISVFFLPSPRPLTTHIADDRQRERALPNGSIGSFTRLHGRVLPRRRAAPVKREPRHCGPMSLPPPHRPFGIKAAQHRGWRPPPFGLDACPR